MSADWYEITRPHHLSRYETDAFVRDGQDQFMELLDSFLASDVVIHNKKVGLDTVELRAIVQNVTSDVYQSTNLRQILTPIGYLHAGQYFEHNSYFWLINTAPDNNQMYEKAMAWFCKHDVNFISPLTGEPVSYPVYSVNSTQYGSGEFVKPMMGIIDARHLVYIPYNEETILLDNGYRFVIDKNKANPTAYRLSQVDSESYSVGEDDGLLQWTIVMDQSRDIDDGATMLADNVTTEQRKGSW